MNKENDQIIIFEKKKIITSILIELSQNINLIVLIYTQ